MAPDCCENVVEQSMTSAPPNFGEPQEMDEAKSHDPERRRYPRVKAKILQGTQCEGNPIFQVSIFGAR
jgi:hypothetical protein